MVVANCNNQQKNSNSRFKLFTFLQTSTNAAVLHAKMERLVTMKLTSTPVLVSQDIEEHFAKQVRF